MKINLNKLQPFEVTYLTKNIIAAFTYILRKEYNIDITSLNNYKAIYNHPQWLAALSVTSLNTVGSMGLIDSAALFPLNVTKQRVLGARKHRSKLFSFGFHIAKLIQSNIKLNEDDIFTSLDIQLAIVFSSMIWVGFDAGDQASKLEKYTKLWTGFSGSYWKIQFNDGII